MRVGKGSAQPVGIRWHDDDVHRAGHQAIAPNLSPGALCRLRQQIAIKRIVCVLKKRLLPAVAALGHVIRNARNDKAGKTGHPMGLT